MPSGRGRALASASPYLPGTRLPIHGILIRAVVLRLGAERCRVFVPVTPFWMCFCSVLPPFHHLSVASPVVSLQPLPLLTLWSMHFRAASLRNSITRTRSSGIPLHRGSGPAAFPSTGFLRSFPSSLPPAGLGSVPDKWRPRVVLGSRCCLLAGGDMEVGGSCFFLASGARRSAEDVVLVLRPLSPRCSSRGGRRILSCRGCPLSWRPCLCCELPP